MPQANLPIPASASLRIAVIYGIFSTLWIFGSGWMVGWLVTDVHGVLMIESVKGVMFVAVSTLLIYTLLRVEEVKRMGTLLALAENEERFRLAVHSSREAVWDWNLSDGRLHYSPGLRTLLGLNDNDDTTREAWLARLHPDDREAVTTAMMAHLDDRVREYEHLHRIRHRDGHYLWVLARGRTVLNADGTPSRFIGTDIDVTGHKRAEEALERANRALSALSAGNRAMIAARDGDGLLRSVCVSLVEEAGYRLAWIGAAEGDPARTIRPVASHGAGADQLRPLPLTDSDLTDSDKGARPEPAATALRTGRAALIHDLVADPAADPDGVSPWRVPAQQNDFRSMVAIPVFEDGRVTRVLAIFAREREAFDSREVGILETLAQDMSFVLNALHDRQRLGASEQARDRATAKLKDAYSQALAALSATLEKRDPYTAGHQERVAALSVQLAQRLGFSADATEGIRLGALMHDIGKVGIPSEILNRPGRLLPEEMALVRLHAGIGYDIVKDLDFPWPIGRIVIEHHERLDGTGYPHGLKGDALCMEARIVGVADVIEAITAHRPYRPALGLAVALEEIRAGSGSRYDPTVVDAVLRLAQDGQLPP